MSLLEEKIETLKLFDDTENVETNDSDTLKESTLENINGDINVADKKKNKKKKKKDKPAPPDTKTESATSLEAPAVLGEANENITDEKLCAFCNKSGPTKRCSKRHPKCLPKMFCNDSCEAFAHEDKKAALVKKEKAKVAAAKKKGMKNKDWKNTDSGQFWWHDQ